MSPIAIALGRYRAISPGKLADFTVLSEDPTAVAPDRIAGLEVVATFLDGDLRYTAPGTDSFAG